MLEIFRPEFDFIYGKAFPKGSPLVSDMSTSVLEILEGKENQEIWKKYFNNTNCNNAEMQENLNRLSLESFWGLFLITSSTSGISLVKFKGFREG